MRPCDLAEKAEAMTIKLEGTINLSIHLAQPCWHCIGAAHEFDEMEIESDCGHCHGTGLIPTEHGEAILKLLQLVGKGLKLNLRTMATR